MPDSEDLRIDIARVEDAAEIVAVIHAAFGARAHVDPPPPALSETAETIAAELEAGSGVVARVGDRAVGAILIAPGPDHTATLCRVSVHPEFQHEGIASLMVPAADQVAASLGCRTGTLVVRREFPNLLAWWQRCGYHVVAEDALLYHLERHLPVLMSVPDADAMRTLGRRLAGILRDGDLLLLEGDLGAGKTTLAQGLGAGLGVDEAVTSPTFVLSHVHHGTDLDLVHVDAYRMADSGELDDLDLTSTGRPTVFCVEWGEGKAEHLAEDRLWISIVRPPDSDERTVILDGHGPRWALDLAKVVDPRASDASAETVTPVPDPTQET